LRKKMPGFMGPVEAVEDAFNDLQAHQKGTMAGMHGVLEALLKRLDPHALAQRTSPPSFIEGIIPSKRTARMWQQSVSLYDQTCREVRSDFQKYFGNDFVLAYEAEIERERERAASE
ncbi:MAG: type VI secretion system-associated FHA domain protein TagH, partial [Pseudomonadota bacterium]|nr:type VI secretion system-associated FHA domain protein TagH [Pseudomonadota bacterium]